MQKTYTKKALIHKLHEEFMCDFGFDGICDFMPKGEYFAKLQ